MLIHMYKGTGDDYQQGLKEKCFGGKDAFPRSPWRSGDLPSPPILLQRNPAISSRSRPHPQIPTEQSPPRSFPLLAAPIRGVQAGQQEQQPQYRSLLKSGLQLAFAVRCGAAC
jgi:hypothetical protein